MKRGAEEEEGVGRGGEEEGGRGGGGGCLYLAIKEMKGVKQGTCKYKMYKMESKAVASVGVWTIEWTVLEMRRRSLSLQKQWSEVNFISVLPLRLRRKVEGEERESRTMGTLQKVSLSTSLFSEVFIFLWNKWKKNLSTDKIEVRLSLFLFRFQWRNLHILPRFKIMWRVYNKKIPWQVETARVTKGIISSLLSKLPSHFKKSKTLRSDMRLKDSSRRRLFFLQRGEAWGNKEKWEWYLSHPSSSHPAGLSASQCWKDGVKKDENEGWFKGESQHRAQGGLVPTERAQWVAETEACWIYKQSIYPARDPERLASAMVIYTDIQPSFTLHYRHPLSLSLPPSPSLHSPWIVSVSGPWSPVSLRLWYLIIVTTDSVTSISFLFRYIIYKAAETWMYGEARNHMEMD